MESHPNRPHDEVEMLFHSRYGYVLRCRHCLLYHLAFGNIAIDQSKQDLIDLTFLIERYHHQYQQSNKESCRCIFIETPFNGFRLVFSLKELALFNEMLQKTYLIIQAEDIINN